LGGAAGRRGDRSLRSEQPVRRRFITIPGYLMAWLVWLGAAPLWLTLALLVDLFRRDRGVALRSASFICVYLTCEVLGMLASAGLWSWNRLSPMGSDRWTDLHFRLETWWGTTLFQAVVTLFGLRLEVEGDADLGRGPYILMLRHASSGDTLLASALVSRPYGLRLRYVLKRELLWDPCLDIVGNRLPNVFVDRFSDDPAREIQRVQELARDLGPRDGILIYPEGTRFSEARRQRLLERIRQRGDEEMLEYARSLESVLPPRTGGTLGLLDAVPAADVVVCSHTGFEGAASIGQIWKGELVNRVLRVQFRRIPRELIPAEPNARIAWICAEWQQVDAWVGSQETGQWK
jgi:1-acyl-sn-glycerol-3-phosphate acyltransferase